MSDTWKPSSEYSVELLADYVEGFTDPATASKIQAHLALHAEDAAVVEGIAAYLSANDGDRDGLEAWLKRTEEAQRVTHATRKEEAPVRSLATRRVWMMAASAAILAFALAWWLLRPTGPQTTEDWMAYADTQLTAEAYPGPTTVRSVETSSLDSLRNRGAQAYDRGQWGLASETFATILEAYPEESGSAERFFLSVSELYRGDAGETTAQRLGELGTGESVYAAPARYYQVLLMLQLGKVEGAKTLAQKALDQATVYGEGVLKTVAK